MAHKTTTLKINGEFCRIDTPMVPLIEAINGINGVSTLNCCQGEYGPAYVQFAGPKALRLLLHLTVKMAALFDEIGTTYTINNQVYGRHFQIDVDDKTFCIRFFLNDLPHVLEACCSVAAA